jgi:iron complex transport system permease protein
VPRSSPDAAPPLRMRMRPAWHWGQRITPRTALIVTVVLLVTAVAASLALGAKSIPLSTVWDAIWNADASNEDHGIVRTLRWDRTLIGLSAGAALAVSGALAQSLTRNPLADPGLLGLNAGAALAIVIGTVFGGVATVMPQVGLALVGAASPGLLVYGVGSGGGASAPIRLALAGAAVTALLTALTTAIVLYDQTALNVLRYWLAGSLTGRAGIPILPMIVVIALLLALVTLFVRPLQAIALGDDAAAGLGIHVARTRAGVMALVVSLAAVSTALAGPIAFVGLAVPHLVRAVTGPRIGWLVAMSIPAGGVVMLAADVAGRLVARPGEVSVGIATALGGGVLLAVLARRLRVVAL